MNSIIVLQSRGATEANEKRRLQVRQDKKGHRVIKMNELKLGFPGAIGLEYQDSDGLWCPLGPDNVDGQEQILVQNNQAEYVVILEAPQTRKHSQLRQLERRVKDITINGQKVESPLLEKSITHVFSKTQATHTARCLTAYGLHLTRMNQCRTTDELWELFSSTKRPVKPVLTIENPPKIIGNEQKNEEKMNMFRYIGENLTIHQMSNDNTYCLSVPYSDTLTFKGRPDAIITDNNNPDLYRACRLMIEYKIDQKKVKTTFQPIMELLGAIVNLKRPVMVLTTDLRVYRFTYLKGSNIVEATTTDKEAALQFMHEWISIDHVLSEEDIATTTKVFNDASRLFFDQDTHVNGVKDIIFIDELPFEVSDPNELQLPDYCKALEEQIVFKRSGLHKANRGRSGQVYFCTLQIGGRDTIIALKLHSCNQWKTIQQEMENEIAIYAHLGDKRSFSDMDELSMFITNNEINWRPRLVYGGFLFNRNYISVCTTYVGQTLSGKTAGPTKLPLFEQVLNKLHQQRVVHRDVRPPNLAWCSTNKTAAILDFGFASIVNNDEEFEIEKAKDFHDLNMNVKHLSD